MKTKLNKTRNRLFLFLALTGLLLVAAACTTPEETAVNTVTESAEVETAVQPEVEIKAETVPEIVEETEAEEETNTTTATAVENPVVESVSAATTTGELSADEIADLMYMREEEKLAHDVYLALYDVWGMNIFQNIAASEQTHTDSVLSLLNTNGLIDPVSDNAAGIFVNADLQALYDELVASGSQSLEDALRVGVAIEEIDIIDLDEAIARTGQADIAQVYQSLRAGSENHLRAFVGTLEQQTGAAYQPEYLSLEAYASIINGSQSQGHGQTGGNGNGGNGKGNGRSNHN